MAELAPTLQEFGFRAVESDLPGGWATNGDVTVAIESHRTSDRGLEHEVRVFADGAGLLSIETECLARTVDSSHELAVRRALDEAGVVDDGYSLPHLRAVCQHQRERVPIPILPGTDE